MLTEIYQAIDPVAFTIGPVSVRWYGLAYLLGFVLAFFIMRAVIRRWKINISADSLTTIFLGIILGVIIGGRLGYCLFYGDGYYLAHPEKILAFSEGGMSFHGGLIGLAVGVAITSHICKIPFLTMADLCAIGGVIGLFFGRIANFINGELWGAPTDLPWGVVFGGAAGMMPRHPSQLYEAILEGLVIFLVLFALSRRVPPRPRGTFFGVFLVLYGIFRFSLEFIREPDAQLGYLFGGWVTMGQMLSVPLVIGGIGLLIYVAIVHLPQAGEPETVQTTSDTGRADVSSQE